MDTLHIRILAADDWPLYRDLRLASLADSPQAFGSTHREESRHKDCEWTRRLANLDPAHYLPLVVETEGRGIGLACGRITVEEPYTAALYQVWVHPAFRGRGAGQLLLATFTEWAHRQGVRRLVLDVTVADSPAMALYHRAGFRPDGPPRPLRPGSEHACQRMCRELGNPVDRQRPLPPAATP